MDTKPTLTATFRAAWNAFSRLLDITFQSSFVYPICGAEPSTMICDGTMLGFRKDLISHIISSPSHPQQTSSHLVAGTNHQDRVLLKSPRSRELLLKYPRDRKESGVLSHLLRVK